MSEECEILTDLCQLCIQYGTDKGPRAMNGWGYSPIYNRLLEGRRFDVRRVLEVGICGYRDIPNNVVGASLFVWRDFFPNAEIWGIDNDPRFMLQDVPRINTLCLNAYDSDTLLTMLIEQTGGGEFDFIVDDAVHDPIPQVNLLNDLWPFLAPGGIYAMEDVCPYKLPDGDLKHMIRHFPFGSHTDVHETHKNERLLIVTDAEM